MQLPPRVKTLYPNSNNIVNDIETPLPIESAFFLEDAQKDSFKSNRYYFDFPGNWITSNNGETIIGIRNIGIIKAKRKLKFTLRIAKLLKTEREKYMYIHSSDGDGIIEACETAVKFCTLKMIFWYQPEYTFEDFFKILHQALIEKINTKDNIDPIFEQNELNSNRRDFQLDEIYDKNDFYIKIFSERNDNYEKPYKEYLEPYLVLFKFVEMNDEFKEVFNIGTLPYQNNPEQYKHWKFDHNFYHIWDRGPCRVYSSLSEQSLHHYIGNSEIEYSPIKYFKLKSTDQKFWIDLFSIYHSIPVNLPKHESFCIEMQLLPYNKNII